MIRTAFKSITVIAGFMLLGSSVLHADSLGPPNDRRHKPTRPSVTTYATGLTNPRGLTFGPDGKLYVAEAGTGGTLTPRGGPDCPIDINVFSPYTAGFSGRVVRGAIETLYDMTIDDREHNPIVMTQRGKNFFVGTFGEDGGKSELAVFDRHFSAYTLPFKSRDPIVGLAWHCDDLHGVEMYTSNQGISFAPGDGEILRIVP